MRKTLLAAAALAALAACSSTATTAPTDKLTIASVMSSVNAQAPSTLAPQEGYAALFDAAPGAITVGAYEPEGTGAVARDVTIAFGETGLGMTISEMRAYGLDAEAGAAFSAEPGTRARLADRLDLRGVSLTGFDAFSERMTEGMLDDVADAMGESLDGMEMEQVFDRYSYTMDRVVLDGATFASLPAAEDPNFLQMMMQSYAAFGADRVVATGVVNDMAMRQTMLITNPETGEQTETTTVTDATSRIAEWGLADWRGADIGFQFVRGLTVNGTDTTDGVQTPPIAFTLGELTGRDLRASEVVDYIFAEQMPPASATDILSLGRWNLADLDIAIADTPFYSIHKLDVDATQFYGLLPENITFTSSETLHLAGLIDAVADNPMAFAEPGEEAPSAEDMAAMRQMVSVLREQGLEAIRSENEGSYSWSPQTGAMAFKVKGVTQDMGAIRFGLDMLLPTHEQFAAVDLAAVSTDLDSAVEGAAGESELGQLMAEVTALDRMELVLDDEGGLNAFLAVMIAVAENAPAEDGDQSMAMLRGQTPEGLRQMLAGLVTMGSVQMAQAVPQVGDYAGALSAWLGQGGELRLVIDPDSPLGAAAIAELQTMPGGPPAMIDRLGIEVTHSE